MTPRPFGDTGLMVSPIGLGTVKFGRNTGVKYPGGDGFPLPTDAQVLSLLRAAADLGINLLDTAPAYGTSEERLGSILHAHNWLGGRDRWILCTKAGEEFDPVTGESRFDFSPAAIRASIERSLRRLRTDRLDAVLLHSDGRDLEILNNSGALETLRNAHRAGLIRTYGISAKTAAGAARALELACTVLMVTYTAHDSAAAEVIDAAATCGAAVLVKKALSSGHAADPAAAIGFALGRAGVSSVVVGTLNEGHLRLNAQAASV